MADPAFVETLQAFFRDRPEPIVAAWLFGSRARGTHQPDSDVDVAVLLRSRPTTLEMLPLDLAADLEKALDLDVDAVALNDASPDLIHRVLRDGVVVCDRDRAARLAFEVAARNEYFDLEPARRLYRRARVAG
jgi:uncharacterized protein